MSQSNDKTVEQKKANEVVLEGSLKDGKLELDREQTEQVSGGDIADAGRGFVAVNAPFDPVADEV